MPRAMTPTPSPVAHALRELGQDMLTWRRLRRLTAEQVADRAGVSRGTVMNLEHGRGSSLENLLRVARALGVLEPLVRAIDPYATDIGRMRAEEVLPQRVSRPRTTTAGQKPKPDAQ